MLPQTSQRRDAHDAVSRADDRVGAPEVRAARVARVALQHDERLAARRVPDADGAVDPRADDPVAARVELRRVDGALVADEDHRVACRRPARHAPSRRCRRSRSSVRRRCRRRRGSTPSWPRSVRSSLPRARVPDPRAAVVAAGQQVPAIGAEGEHVDARAGSAQPDAPAPVGSLDDERRGAADGDPRPLASIAAANFSPASVGTSARSSARDVPQPDRAVLGRADDPVAGRGELRGRSARDGRLSSRSAPVAGVQRWIAPSPASPATHEPAVAAEDAGRSPRRREARVAGARHVRSVPSSSPALTIASLPGTYGRPRRTLVSAHARRARAPPADADDVDHAVRAAGHDAPSVAAEAHGRERLVADRDRARSGGRCARPRARSGAGEVARRDARRRPG